jgi:Transglycosylase-like domain
VLRTGSTPLTGPGTDGPARRTFRVLLLPVLLVLAAIPMGAALRPAGADPIASLQAQAATVSQYLVLEQLQVDADQQQSSVVGARVTADQEAIAALDRQLVADQQAIARHLRVVQAQAIRSYIDSGADSSSTDGSLFQGGSATAQAASEYASLAVGTITTDLDQLHSAQRTLQDQQAELEVRQNQDRADQAQESAALDQATTAAAKLQSEQSLVTGKLAAAVAAQQAAQAQAVAAALASAPKSAPPASAPPATIPVAASTVAVTSTPTPTTGPARSDDPYPNLPDPALNPFLTCVVQAESGGNYGAVSPNGTYMGAFQFSQSTWNIAAQAAGLGLLVGVPPNLATRAEQDTVAVALYALDGERPWLGDRCSGG